MKVTLVMKLCKLCKLCKQILSVLRRAFQVLMFKTFITRVTFITPSHTLGHSLQKGKKKTPFSYHQSDYDMKNLKYREQI